MVAINDSHAIVVDPIRVKYRNSHKQGGLIEGEKPPRRKNDFALFSKEVSFMFLFFKINVLLCVYLLLLLQKKSALC